MIRGARHWNDRGRYYIQSNNSIESALERYGAEVSAVACGPTSAINCLEALGVPVESETPAGWRPQPEDVLTLWFHDQRNWDELRAVRGGTDPASTRYSPNEVPQYYPPAVRAVFGARAEFAWVSSHGHVASLIDQGNAVMICFRRPGHYVAAVAYDDEEGELIYHDSWPSRFPSGNGFARRLDREEYAENVRPFAVIFCP